jgi:hypothetical protein
MSVNSCAELVHERIFGDCLTFIWLTGLATYMKEAVTNYGLSEVGDPTERDKRGTLWQEYVDQSGVPWLATIHPTGARMSTNEFARVKGKLAQLAPGVSVRQI